MSDIELENEPEMETENSETESLEVSETESASENIPENVPQSVEQDLAELARIREEIRLWEEDRTLRPLTPKDALYLIDQCPFLQIVNADYATYGEVDFKVVRLKSGWDLHHYGDAMSASPGRLLFGLGARHSEDGTDDDEGSGGKGTIVKQAVDAAMQMVELAIEKNWGGIMAVDGHPLMLWAAWVKCSESGLTLQGYTPTDTDYLRLGRAEMTPEQIDAIKQRLRKV